MWIRRAFMMSYRHTHSRNMKKARGPDKKYEFGSKVSVVSTSRKGFIVGAVNFVGNPYDGHTLMESIDQMERICGVLPEKIFVDKGYRGHDYEGDAGVYLPGQYRKRGAPPRKWFKRRSGVEATISHV